MAIERQKEIRRRRHRSAKVRRLRGQLEKTTNVRQRSAIIRKIQRASPDAPVPEA